MIISPELFRLLFNDPKEFGKWRRGRSDKVFTRDTIEMLTLSNLYDKENSYKYFIPDVNAPACQLTVKILTDLAGAVNDHFLSFEDLSDNDIEHYMKVVSEGTNTTIEKVKECCSKYKEYYNFLIERKNKTVITEKHANIARYLVNDIKSGLKMSSVSMSGHYEKEKQEIRNKSKTTRLETVFMHQGAVYSTELSKFILLRNEDFILTDPKYGDGYKFPVDILNYNVEKEIVSITLVKRINKRLTEIKDVIFENLGLNIELGAIQKFWSSILKPNLSKIAKLEVNLIATDPFGYTSYFEINGSTLDQCYKLMDKKFNEAVIAVGNENHDRYPEFHNGGFIAI